MSANTTPLEQDTRVLIDTSLENLGWKLSGHEKNVFMEQPKTESERQLLEGKRPDYVLYSNEGGNPLIIIEAKKKGTRLDAALEQGIYYARKLNAPLVFATDGVFCKTFHTGANRPPILNGEEIDEFIREALALKYLNTYEVNTVSTKVQYDRKELIRIFDEANNMLRGEGLRAGIERFGEFANILFLKLVSESEQVKRDSGIKSNFDYACSWDCIKEIPLSTRIEYINKTVYEKLNNLYKTEIFTPLQIKDVSILKEIMGKLDPLNLTDVDSDVKGDAFEYFLKASTATKNDLGEYFTPRHIVKTMVRLVNPTIGEKVYDPFCGTGGFLIESFRHIHNNMARTETNYNILRESTIYGNEITNTARITKMNMILAGDGHSNIEMKDSLANPVDGNSTYLDKDSNAHHYGYDIVLANMPYSQRTKYGNLYDISSTNGDSICVQHCIKAINSASPNGRMAIVVPEGFLFRKDLTRTREYLLSHSELQSIISLPQGVFLPYTSVKTDIIYAVNVNKKNTSKRKKYYWYFDVKNDGYTLDNHRRKIDTRSDLSKYEEFRKLDPDQHEDMINVGFEIIPIDKIKENSYILVGSRYREAKMSISSEISYSTLSDISTISRGITFSKSAQLDSKSEKSLGIITTKAAQADGIDFNSIIYIKLNNNNGLEKLVMQDDILISIANSLDKVGRVTFVDSISQKLSFGAFMGLIRADKTKILPKYLYWVLQSEKAKEYFRHVARTTTNVSNLTFEDIGNFAIPLPSSDFQHRIVKELDEYQNIILGARKILANYQPHISLDSTYKNRKIKDLCSINAKTINPQEKFKDESFIYIDISSIEAGSGIVDKSQSIRGIDAPSRARRHFAKGDILLSTVRPNRKSFCYVDFDTENFVASTGLAVIHPKKEINGKYLFYVLLSNDMVDQQFNSLMAKAMYPSVTKSDIENIEVPVVALEKQEEIVKNIEREIAVIAPNRQIINIFLKKIENIINTLWK